MSERICGIYKITSPTGRIYIGQSIDVCKRERYYKRLACKKQPKLYNSIKKHGWESHFFEVIEECSIDELNGRERYWQDFYNVIGDKGLNCMLTSALNKKLVHCSHTRIKMSQSHKGKIFSEDHKRKIGDAHRGEGSPNWGRKHTIETRIKVSNALRGRRHSEETKKKMSESQLGEKNHRWGKKTPSHMSPMFGKKLSQEAKNKISKAHKGKKKSKNTVEKIRAAKMGEKNPMYGTVSPVAKMVICTETGIFFSSIREAAISKNIKESTLKWWLRLGKTNKTTIKYI